MSDDYGYVKVCKCMCGHAFKQKLEVKVFSHVRLFAIPWTVAYQAPPSMEFSRQEHWNGLPFPPPGDLPHPGLEPGSLVPPALAGGPPRRACVWVGVLV